MPLSIDLLQILLHMLNFAILAGGLTFLLYKPVCKFLDERKEYFENLERENEQARAEVDELKAKYEESLEKSEIEIADKKAEAEREMARISKEYIADAKAKAEAIVHAAEREAEDRKEHILDAAQTEIGELVVTAAQKLLSDTVTPERNSALYDEFIRLAEQTVSKKRSKK